MWSLMICSFRALLLTMLSDWCCQLITVCSRVLPYDLVIVSAQSRYSLLALTDGQSEGKHVLMCCM